MFTKLTSIILASVVVSGYASPLSRSLTVHDKRSTVPSGFTLDSAAPANQVLNLRVALVNSNITGLESELYAVSTPTSSRYGQHLTKDQVSIYCHLALGKHL